MLNNDSLFSERKYPGKLTTAQHFTLREIQEVMGSELNNFQLFAVVRNPFDRIVSEFNHIQHNDWATAYKNLNFDEFVDKALNTDVDERIRIFDAHMETQSSFLQSSNNTSIKVFKYEQLDLAFDWINQTTGNQFEFGHERKSTRCHYSTYYHTSSTVQKIVDFYREDFEQFEYSVEVTMGSPQC